MLICDSNLFCYYKFQWELSAVEVSMKEKVNIKIGEILKYSFFFFKFIKK